MQMLDNFGNFASWTEWSLAFALFSETRPNPVDPTQKIQVLSPRLVAMGQARNRKHGGCRL